MMASHYKYESSSGRNNAENKAFRTTFKKYLFLLHGYLLQRVNLQSYFARKYHSLGVFVRNDRLYHFQN